MMENGGLSDKFDGLTIDDAEDTSLFQVMKAVEAAEASIRHQVEENNRLKEELIRRNRELEALKLDKPVAQRNYSINASDEDRQGINKDCQPGSILHPSGTLALHQDSRSQPEESMRPFHIEGYSSVGHSNGYLNTLSSSQPLDTLSSQPLDNAGFSQLSSPSPTSFSPGRYLKNNEFGSRLDGTVQGLTPVVDSNNNSNLWKQSNPSLVQKIKENEEEITQLRKHLSEYSVKEAQICNEKYVLEKRIAHMRMAFDQQQQDLVDAASKALSYRQDIIEENVCLTYALQDAQQERTIFVTSLLPILAEYTLQPQVSDAQSIVSNIKFLFRHLQEKLIITEAKLKESQYQLTPWRSDGNNPNFASQSLDYSSGATHFSNKIGLEMVPWPAYSPANLANTDSPISVNWESRRQHTLQAGASGAAMQSPELDNMGRYSPLGSREAGARDSSSQGAFNRDEMQAAKREFKFKDPVSSSEAYGVAAGRPHNEREHARNWDAGTSASNTIEDPTSSYSPYLQPVPEEPSSSFSEAAEDDPLPAIEGLQISGEAYPGRELQACGYSINGTTSCNFEWVRHMEDGSVKYIDGAKQPIYLVTADDVETYLAIEVQPLDDQKRKGELVKVFANEHRKIVCDPTMQNHVEQMLQIGNASYKVLLSTGFLDIWEPANLTVKRDGYSIKGSGSSVLSINEKFSPGITVIITYGHDFDFSISNPNGVVHLVRAENYMEDIASLRDLIVLTLRLFIMKALHSGKGKKRSVKLFSK